MNLLFFFQDTEVEPMNKDLLVCRCGGRQAEGAATSLQYSSHGNRPKKEEVQRQSHSSSLVWPEVMDIQLPGWVPWLTLREITWMWVQGGLFQLLNWILRWGSPGTTGVLQKQSIKMK
ncbi:uncharacterized protein LOC115611683 isoform X2 [Strigops habroptila]|uniref:uncharacterized protein LOC115611683 isoform X2 n=1 Tax=Strigops habroptila TaxID=2489341 RepID=UPI0011CF7A88|nr:uncharacterized protein LOC115611683 isoform X2 [Strigops habroptila]